MLDRKHVKGRHGGEEFLGFRIHKTLIFMRPARPFQEETIDKTTIFWPGSLALIEALLLVLEQEGESHGVNRHLVFASIVLEDGSEKALREEESRDPKGGGGATLDPILQELCPLKKIFIPWSKGLQGGVGLGSPTSGDLLIEHIVAHLLQIR